MKGCPSGLPHWDLNRRKRMMIGEQKEDKFRKRKKNKKT